MKVATCNIGEDTRNKDGKTNLKTYEYIVEVITKENIDVICLQEAIIKSDKLPTIAKYIKEHTSLKNFIEFELSDSHINIGSRMGVIICSKYPIQNYEFFMLDNPNLTYQVDENTTYYTHDKGFIIANINNTCFITGHGIPFHVFKTDELDYLDIYQKAEKKLLEAVKQAQNYIFCADLNSEKINELFPTFMSNSIDLVDCPTYRNSKIYDHFIIKKDTEGISGKVLDGPFDHKVVIFQVNV